MIAIKSCFLPHDRRSPHKDAIHEPGGGICHAAASAGRTEAATLAAEADDAILAASIAIQTDEAMGQDATLEKAAQFAFDEPGHRVALLLPAIQKGLELLTHYLIQDALLRLASAVSADRCPATSAFASML